MLPPVMDVVVVWHPDDPLGRRVGDALVEHFHGTTFSGLIGGAVEVYVRSTGWAGPGSAPRPLPLPGSTAGGGTGAQFVAVVPVMSRAMADAVGDGGPWADYVEAIAHPPTADPDRFACFPLTTPARLEGSRLVELLGALQRVGLVEDATADGHSSWLRDLVQGLTQFVRGRQSRIAVFISHTRQASGPDDGVAALTGRVREAIAGSRLTEFFDAHDLQVSEDWARALREAAGRSALLALRTDRYSSRAWCQEEVRTAKLAGMPLVVLDALVAGEERGSFLMDHVPRVPVSHDGAGWSRTDVGRGLSLLVDEALKRALWDRQRELAEETGSVRVSWWAPHAPEPVTLAAWLDEHDGSVRSGDGSPVLVLHPDPPLGPQELETLRQVVRLTGSRSELQVVTPGQLNSRTG